MSLWNYLEGWTHIEIPTGHTSPPKIDLIDLFLAPVLLFLPFFSPPPSLIHANRIILMRGSSILNLNLHECYISSSS